MGFGRIIDELRYRLSDHMYQCHYCYKYFNLNFRLSDISKKLPEDAVFTECGDLMNYCSDKCHKEDQSAQQIVNTFTDEK